MNIRMILYILGWVICMESLFLCLPMIAGLVYGEAIWTSYAVVAMICLTVGGALRQLKPKNTAFYAREGFTTVALSWTVLGFLGALPFVLGGEITSYVDALFETVSGFTTTGATILSDVEKLSHASILWRSTTHWVGGVGVLVFVLTIIPLVGGHSIYLLRAESTGPSVNKLGPRMKDTAAVLYGIYIVMTLILLALLLGGGMSWFEAINTALSTAGTGGFGFRNDSMASFSPYIRVVVAVFMLLFGINFNLYYCIYARRPKDFFKSEELWVYVGIAMVATLLITVNIWSMVGELPEALNHAFFQVTAIMSTTGFSTTDFNQWPEFSRMILVALIFVGGSAGSTAGGMKVSRIILLFKGVRRELKLLVHPRAVGVIHFEGRRVQHEVSRSVNMFFIAYMGMFVVSMLLLSLDQFDFLTNFTSTVTTLSNVGPGLNVVGPLGNFSGFSPFSKLLLTFNMLAGRLELFPMLLLFMPSTWKCR